MEGEIKRLKRELKCEGAITKYYKDTVLLQMCIRDSLKAL